MAKYVYTYSVKNLATGKTIARGFGSKGLAQGLAADASASNSKGEYVVRQHRAELDTESSVSAQHFIDTGRYLTKAEVAAL